MEIALEILLPLEYFFWLRNYCVVLYMSAKINVCLRCYVYKNA